MTGLRKLRLISADTLGGGMRDEDLRVSAWEANLQSAVYTFHECKRICIHDIPIGAFQGQQNTINETTEQNNNNNNNNY